MKKTLFSLLLIITSLTFFLLILLLFKNDSDWLISLTQNRSSIKKYTEVAYVDIPSVIVSLPGRADQYCKAGFTLEISEGDSRHFKNHTYTDVMQSMITTLLSDYPTDKLLSYKGKLQLKEHIRISINKKLDTDIIDEVYFREFILQ